MRRYKKIIKSKMYQLFHFLLFKNCVSRQIVPLNCVAPRLSNFPSSNCEMSTPENIDISNIPAINHKYFAYFSKIADSQATRGVHGGPGGWVDLLLLLYNYTIPNLLEGLVCAVFT